MHNTFAIICLRQGKARTRKSPNRAAGWTAALAASCAVAASAFAAPTMTATADGKYEISVPSGEEYTLTTEDVSSIGSYDLVKGGEGTLVAGAVMMDFAQSIYITNGVYRLVAQGGLGSVSSETATYVSDGGTLVNEVTVNTSDWNATPSCGTDRVYVEGTGYKGLGAISNAVSTLNFSMGFTLTGDATVSSSQGFYFRRYGVDMGGHTLTVESHGQPFALTALAVSNPGRIDANGHLQVVDLSGGSALPSGMTVNVLEGQRLTINGASSQNASLTMGANSTVSLTKYTKDTAAPGSETTPCLWAGPVELQGATSVETLRGSDGKVFGLTLSGYVHGDGGFTNATAVTVGSTGDKIGGWLKLTCPTNAFKGGVAMVSDATLDAPSGGVAAFVDGAVPADGGPVVIGNSSLWLGHDGFASVNLPDVAVLGSGVVTGGVSTLAADGWTMATNCATLNSLSKTGDGVLDLKSAVRVAGRTEIGGGTLRLGTSRDPNAGLDVSYRTNYCASVTADLETIRSAFDGYSRGACPEGVAAAYHAWPRVSSAAKEDISHSQTYFYEGYIKVPGEAGATTNATFLSSMFRNVLVVIGDKTVVQMNDVYDVLKDNFFTDWNGKGSRLGVNTISGLPCGWQKIAVVCANNYNSSSGPHSSSGAWTDNFGIGVDWLARGTTNVADYAKLVDPGDGSFLRRSLDAASEVASLRPSFGGSVAFAAGTTLDLGDANGAAPLAVSALEGLPSVTNGVLNVAGATWTVSAADIAAGGALQIADGATVTFPSEVTIDVTDAATLRRAWGVRRGVILSAATAAAYPSATTFVLSDAAKAANWRLERVGNALQLVYSPGGMLIIR